jgi:hypothetical protein
MRTTIMVAALALSLGAVARAGDPPTVKERLHNQQNRIEHGVENGELTRKEAQRLRKGQREVRDMRQDAPEDGVVTQRERQAIKREQKDQSQRIYDQKHDAQDRN